MVGHVEEVPRKFVLGFKDIGICYTLIAGFVELYFEVLAKFGEIPNKDSPPTL